jgi:recombination protein RecR
MRDLAEPMAHLVEELKRLPGIGQKSAQRIAFHIHRATPEEAKRLAETIQEVKEKLRTCSTCNNITDVDPCGYCTDPSRDGRLICVVEESHNVPAIEKTREYRGLYHVLAGALSPLRGVGPEQLQIKSLIERLKGGNIIEIIVATDPDVEGEATALYLARLIKPLGIKVTRIARGVPVGSELDFADEITVQKAMEGRQEL